MTRLWKFQVTSLLKFISLLFKRRVNSRAMPGMVSVRVCPGVRVHASASMPSCSRVRARFDAFAAAFELNSSKSLRLGHGRVELHSDVQTRKFQVHDYISILNCFAVHESTKLDHEATHGEGAGASTGLSGARCGFVLVQAEPHPAVQGCSQYAGTALRACPAGSWRWRPP